MNAVFSSKEKIDAYLASDRSEAVMVVPEWSWIAYACRRSLNEKAAIGLGMSDRLWHGVVISVIPHKDDLLMVTIAQAEPS